MVHKEFDQARLIPENQDVDFQTALNNAEEILLNAGVTWPVSASEQVQSIQSNQSAQRETIEAISDPDREWERQADTLAGLFAKSLGMTQSEYKGRFFDFRFPQPESYKGRFDTLTLVQVPVEEKLPLSRILEIAVISKWFDVSQIKNWSKSKFQAPKVPYATWMHDGLPNLGRTVDDVRNTLEADSRGGKTIDGVNHYLQNPTVLSSHFMDFSGDQVGTDGAPSLDHWDAKPELGLYWTGGPGGGCGSLVAGVEVRTQSLKP